MHRSTRLLALLAVFSCGVGCTDDPAPRPFGPGASGPAGADKDGGSGSQPSSSTSGPAAQDASADHDPGFRDPQQTDGGCTAPNGVCNGKCVALGTDTSNCGKCGNACTGPGAACVAAICTCTGPLFDYCDGTGCMDVSSDVNNCGRCNNACDPNQFNACVAGVCVQNM